MIPLDTSPEAAEVQLEIQRRLGPSGRLRIAIELSDLTRRLAEAGLRQRHPNASADEIRRKLVKQLYGIDLPR